MGTGTLAGGIASLTTSSLTSGTSAVMATYGGSSNFSAGSALLTQTVNPVGSPSYTLATAALSPGFVTSGNMSTSIVTVTPANGYTGSVNLFAA